MTLLRWAFLNVIAWPLMVFGQESMVFEDYFIDATLRLDYFHTGSKTEEFITIDHLYKQGTWAGSTTQLRDPFMNGRYAVKMYDAASGKLLFSKAYDAYFGEYKTTDPAKKGIRRTYHESVLLPFPKRPVRIDFERRDRMNFYTTMLTETMDPSDYHVITESVPRGDSVYVVLDHGDPHRTVDVLIVGEGYTAGERAKFVRDLHRYCDVLFGWEPFKRHKSQFSVRGIFSPSPESGTDEPRQGKYRKTVLSSSFNSLDSDRYLLVEDNRTLRDMAAQAPYDALLIMVNSTRYGGGGLYNVYCCFTSDGTWNEHVMQHEFGHSFAGLGDEYYTRDVAYEEFLPRGVEPTEPNITALLDPSKLKWRDLVSAGVPIPTEWGQMGFDSLGVLRDSLSNVRATQIGVLKAEGRSDDEIRKATAKIDTVLARVGTKLSRFFLDHPLRGKVGAFEGGAYVPKGFYRPTVNSLMNAFNAEEKTFYPVNERAIINVIKFYSE